MSLVTRARAVANYHSISTFIKHGRSTVFNISTAPRTRLARRLHVSSIHYSLSDTVKGLVYDILPTSVLDPDTKQAALDSPDPSVQRAARTAHSPSRTLPTIINSITGTRVLLPPHMSDAIKSIHDPSERIMVLIRKYPFIPPKTVLLLVKPVYDILSEKALAAVSVFLYRNFFCREACHLIVSSLSFASAVSFVSSKFIPAVLGETDPLHTQYPSSNEDLFDLYSKYHLTPSHTYPLDRADFLLSTIISSFIAHGHEKLAKHVLQELPDTVRAQIPSFSAPRLLADSKLVATLLEVASASDLAATTQSRKLKRFYLAQEDTVKLAVLKALLVIGNFSAFSNFVNADKRFAGSPYVVRNLVSEMVHQYQLTNDATIVNYLSTFFVGFLKKSVELKGADLAVLPHLATARFAFSRLWTAAKDRLDFNSQRAYAAFLDKSISLKLSHTTLEILCAASPDDAPLCASALSVVLWSQRKRAAVPVTPDIDPATDSRLHTSMLETAIASVPASARQAALYLLLRRLNKEFTTESVPGPVLWTLLAALARSPHTAQLSRPVEKELAQLVAARPVYEQLCYYRLRCVSPDGIFSAVCAYIKKLPRTLGDTVPLDTDESVRLIFSALYAAREKADDNTNMPAVARSLYESATAPHADTRSDLFSRDAVSALRPSDTACIQLVTTLATHSQFPAALYVVNALGDFVPDAVFFVLLAHGARDYPFICCDIQQWLTAARRAAVPANVLRQMATGFAQGRALNDSQSTERVAAVVHTLAARGRGLGRDASAAYVDSLLARAVKRGRGSRNRLKWAIAMAKRQNVGAEQVDRWVRELEYMRSRRVGYWDPRRAK